MAAMAEQVFQLTHKMYEFWMAAAWHRAWLEDGEPFIQQRLGVAPAWLKCFPAVHAMARKLQENVWAGHPMRELPTPYGSVTF